MNLRANNNFDFLRFMASSLVIFSHSFALINQKASEPLFLVSGGQVSSGRIAVIVFFVISGFLISSSWQSKNNFSTFMVARISRIFPGLAVMLCLTIFAGSFLSTANMMRYLSSASAYFLKNLTLYKGQFDLVGVFEGNPLSSAVNGSLWTLRLEFTCYLVIVCLGVCGALRRRIAWLIWGCGLALSMVNGLPTTFIRELLPLLVWFTSGMLVYLYRDVIFPMSFRFILLSIIFLFLYFRINLIFISPIIAFFLVQLTYVNSPFVNFGKYGDFSYGIYIYAFPIQQFVVYLMIKSILQPMAWWVVFLISFPLTLLCAVASWHLVEKRFLGVKKKTTPSIRFAVSDC